jgi:hypothetical protein
VVVALVVSMAVKSCRADENKDSSKTSRDQNLFQQGSQKQKRHDRNSSQNLRHRREVGQAIVLYEAPFDNVRHARHRRIAFVVARFPANLAQQPVVALR